MTSDENRRVALITGSGRRRVGNIIARSLADRGYQIALHYHRSRDEAMESCDEIRAQGVECEAFQADVADEDSVREMCAAATSRFGRLDVLVTTASIWQESTLESVTAAELRQSFDINTLGTFFAAKYVGEVMVKQPEGGSIITIGDWAIARPYLDHVAYFLAKGAIPTLTRVLAREFAQRNSNVRVNCIHPGPVMLPPGSSEQEQQRRIDSTLVKSADCPEVIAQAVHFLIDNRFVTGIEIPVDGGRHMFAMEEGTSI